ncbi:MAG: Hpt domain-containing protein, partial [Leptospiraceae bacterium]|nr:Hpt domain-containing protein [Leptospiraceae bacterium]
MERGQIFREFVQDSIELLDEIERQLLELEEYVDRSSTELPEIIGALFRSFHSVKGTSGFFDLALVVRTSHEAESLLDLFRSGSILIATDYIDALMECQEFLADFFHRLAEKPESLDRPELAEQSRAIGSRLSVMCSEVKELGSATMEASMVAPNDPEGSGATETAIMEAQTNSAPRFALFDSEETSVLPQQNQEIVDPKPSYSDTPATRTNSSKTIRIDTEKLDGLMELVGEFSIGVSLVDDAARRREEHQELFRIRMNQLKKTARHLQELSLSLRMVPLSQVFEKMKRLVRDLQRKTGKPFSLTVKGGDTEVDKTVVELLSEPLVHLMRNAVDHGLESPE